MAELDLSRELRLHDRRSRIREALAAAVTLMRSASQVQLGKSISIDDFRRLELEELIGPENDDAPLIQHSQRRLSDLERLNETVGGVRASIAAIRNEPELVVGSSGVQTG